MKVIKYQQKNTYKGQNGKDYHYYGYCLVLDNGKKVVIKCLDSRDYAVLDAICEYVASSK